MTPLSLLAGTTVAHKEFTREDEVVITQEEMENVDKSLRGWQALSNKSKHLYTSEMCLYITVYVVSGFRDKTISLIANCLG